MLFPINKYYKFIEEIKKPFFLYDGEILEKKYKLIKNNFPEIIDVFFSMKANPNINFIKIFKNIGAGLEIASIGELTVCLKMGISPKRIVFAGPAKSIEGLTMAIENEIYSINIESVEELKRVNEISKLLNKVQVVNIRVNPKFKIENSLLQMGGGAMKFGIDEEQLINYKDLFLTLENIKIDGIHVFAASQILDENLIVDYFINVFNLVRKLEKNLNFKINTLDIGSGFGIDYEKKGNELNMFELGNSLKEIFRFNEDIVNRKNFKVILESGRYLSAESGIYVSEVTDIKISQEKKFILVKGGVNHLLRPALIEQDHKIEILNNSDEKEIVSIGGQLCTGLDFFVRDNLLNKMEIGDAVVILDCGAYGYSESMLYFLSHDFPKEYLIYNRNISQIRKSKNSIDIINEQIEIDFI